MPTFRQKPRQQSKGMTLLFSPHRELRLDSRLKMLRVGHCTWKSTMERYGTHATLKKHTPQKHPSLAFRVV